MSSFDSDEQILPAKLAADKGYRAAWIDDWLLERQIEPVIPSKGNEDRVHGQLSLTKLRTDGVVSLSKSSAG